MKFWKMNGAGNDFIIINNMIEKLPREVFGELARVLCERHLSVGADGLMALDFPDDDSHDVRMLFYNSDGTMGEMCGNGARCVSRYCYENSISRGDTQIIETTAGVVTGQRVDAENYRVRLNDTGVMRLGLKLDVDGVDYTCAYVELGNPGIPHLVVPFEGNVKRHCGGEHLKDTDEGLLRELGRALRWHRSLSKGANVNFYEILDRDTLFERTFERGVEDFTYACGTGTGSVVAVLALEGSVSGRNVNVGVCGGELKIDLEEVTPGKTANSSPAVRGIFLTGPAAIIAIGEIKDGEALKLINT